MNEGSVAWSLLFIEDLLCAKYLACACMLSHFNSVQLFATLWTVACQAPLYMGFFWQEYWTGLPFPSPGALLDPGIDATSPESPALAGGFFTTDQPRNFL